MTFKVFDPSPSTSIDAYSLFGRPVDTPAITLFVGMIGSGKSSLAREWARHGDLVVSHDGLTEMLHAEYRYEQSLRELYRRMEDDLVRRIVGNRMSVIIDRTHLTRESRDRWIRAAIYYSVPIYAVVFPFAATYHSHACRRYNSDPRGRSLSDWAKVAEHHRNQWQAEPLVDPAKEGFTAAVQLPDSWWQHFTECVQ